MLDKQVFDKRWLIRAGALLILIGFVLPSMTVSCSMLPQAAQSFSLLDLSGAPVDLYTLYILLLSALVVLVLAFLPDSVLAPKVNFWSQAGAYAAGILSVLLTLLSVNSDLQQAGFNVSPEIGALFLVIGLVLVPVGLVLIWPEVSRPVGSGWPTPDIQEVQDWEPYPALPSPYLRVIHGAYAQKKIALNREDLSIGRGSYSDIHLEDPTVSRTHARLRLANGAWFIQDQGSKIGIRVNDQPVSAARLQPGDEIVIGEYIFEFTLE